jgi:hypothetical protein
MERRATITNAFRYTEEELGALDDAIHEVTKRYGAKVTKQDLVRLALHAVLFDYRGRGDSSLLGAFASRKRRQ